MTTPQPTFIAEDLLRDGDILDRQGVLYEVVIRNPGDDLVQIQTGEEIRAEGLAPGGFSVLARRIKDDEVVSIWFEEERNDAGDLGWGTVKVWR
ncbi:hypothetical protein [Dietzia kunjamensis]|jgi:hypothetical protein|uniref:hypothetical protein n=1 Tax=Dietzia kunjamensis TaxID=322509 RepID=UPI0039BC951A